MTFTNVTAYHSAMQLDASNSISGRGSSRDLNRTVHSFRCFGNIYYIKCFCTPFSGIHSTNSKIDRFIAYTIMTRLCACLCRRIVPAVLKKIMSMYKIFYNIKMYRSIIPLWLGFRGSSHENGWNASHTMF